MTRVRVLTVLATVAVVLAVSPWSFASSITLISSGGGVYDYGLTVSPNSTVSFAHNATITLSGLSGVTGASRSDFLIDFTVTSVTPSSVVYTLNLDHITGLDIENIHPTPDTVGTLVVDSSVLTLGTVNFRLGGLSGTTQGPVVRLGAVPVPEPSSLVLLGTGLLGLVGLVRRKASR